MVRSATPLPGATARERYGFLEQNFDRSLLQLFSEVHYWERLHFEIPYVAMDISAHRERYRCLRENVMLVVRDYNSILHALSPQVTGSAATATATVSPTSHLLPA